VPRRRLVAEALTCRALIGAGQSDRVKPAVACRPGIDRLTPTCYGVAVIVLNSTAAPLDLEDPCYSTAAQI
jgi:hypothetical protein